MSSFPKQAEFDLKLPQLEALARDWAERECTSFDDAVRKAAGERESECSIWDMPEVDSKRTVSLLAELEPVLGCKLPISLVRRGGYASVDDLVAHLFPKMRQLCPDAAKPGLVATTPSLELPRFEATKVST